MNAQGRVRDLDIVVYGATGFVGTLVAEHLAAHAPQGVRVALASRSSTRLDALRSRLDTGWPIIVADADDAAALRKLAAATHVVITTVGPYAKHGRLLAHACAAAGTDYVDLTGEVLFARASAEDNHDLARSTGARIVHSCGFDSVPSDIGVRALYALSPCPADEPDLGPQPDLVVLRGPDVDPSLRGSLAPFVMAPYNTRVVRRSNALRNWAYGRRLRYREVISVGSSPLSHVIAAGMKISLGALAAAMTAPPTRSVIDRILPKPGQGPSEQTRRAGHFTVDLFTTTTTGARYTARVKADGDPGYAATAVMIGEAALALVLDHTALPASEGGVLTPATGIGDALVRRLRAAGVEIHVRATSSP